jgi:hypothetical protein
MWISSVIFSLVVLVGYRSLEQRMFLPVVGILALVHLLTVITRAARLSWHLFLSQSMVVAATLVGVVLHVLHVIGQVPSGVSSTLSSFVHAALTSPSTYLYFGAYLMVFGLVLGVLLLVLGSLWRRVSVDSSVALATAYTMSSVNVAFDYSLSRPLYHVSGEPGALDFFFTAGLFGVEFSLPLHLLLLVVCVFWHQLAGRRTEVRREGRSLREGAPS